MAREHSRKVEEEHKVEDEKARQARAGDVVRRRSERPSGRPNNGSPLTRGLLTAGAVGLGVVFIEEELLGGVLLGAVAALSPNLLPRIGRALRPALKSVIRAGYGFVETTREAIAEAGEQFEDIVAEVRSERTTEHPAPGATERAGEPRPA
jgi:hypothetical protein